MVTKIAKRSAPRRSLGEPPPPSAARGNLAEPEVAAAAAGATDAPPGASRDEERVDGRTLRRTGRTEQFATRVHPQFRDELVEVARVTGKRYNEILEESLALYRERLGLAKR